jgi:hypothetical protein
MPNQERDSLEERVQALLLEILHLVAELVTSTDKSEVEGLRDQIQDRAATLEMLTREDMSDVVEKVGELAKLHKQAIDDGMARDVQVAIIIAGAKDEEEFKALMKEMRGRAQEEARRRHADEMDGQSRDGTQEGGRTSSEEPPERKVDPEVLDDLPTVQAN